MAFISSQQLVGVSALAEGDKLLAVMHVNRTNVNLHRFLLYHEDFERCFGLSLRVLCFHRHLVESNRSVSLDPEDTPSTVAEPLLRLCRIRRVFCRVGLFLVLRELV